MDEGSAVSQDAGSAPAEQSTSTPAPSAADTSSAAASSQPAANASQQSQSRVYQQAEVEKIIQARLEQAQRSFEKRLKDSEARQQQAARAFAQHAGVLPPEPKAPQFVPVDQFQQSIHSLKEELRKEQQTAVLTAKVESDWGAVEKAHPEYAKLPGFQDAFLRVWSSNPAGGPELAKEIVKAYDDYFTSRQAKYSQEKQQAAQTTVIAPGNGATAPQKTNLTTRDRIKAALAGGSTR